MVHYYVQKVILTVNAAPGFVLFGKQVQTWPYSLSRRSQSMF